MGKESYVQGLAFFPQSVLVVEEEERHRGGDLQQQAQQNDLR